MLKAFGAKPGASGLYGAGLDESAPCETRRGLWGEGGEALGLCVVPLTFLPGILAVGGGGRPVLCTWSFGETILRFVPCCGCLEGVCLGAVPPYFCSNSWVLSYLVAFFSAVIFSSLCVCRYSRCDCCLFILQLKKRVISWRTP